MLIFQAVFWLIFSAQAEQWSDVRIQIWNDQTSTVSRPGQLNEAQNQALLRLGENEDRVYRSSNGGKTWRLVFKGKLDEIYLPDDPHQIDLAEVLDQVPTSRLNLIRSAPYKIGMFGSTFIQARSQDQLVLISELGPESLFLPWTGPLLEAKTVGIVPFLEHDTTCSVVAVRNSKGEGTFAFWGNRGRGILIYPKFLNSQLNVVVGDSTIDFVDYDLQLSAKNSPVTLPPLQEIPIQIQPKTNLQQQMTLNPMAQPLGTETASSTTGERSSTPKLLPPPARPPSFEKTVKSLLPQDGHALAKMNFAGLDDYDPSFYSSSEKNQMMLFARKTVHEIIEMEFPTAKNLPISSRGAISLERSVRTLAELWLKGQIKSRFIRDLIESALEVNSNKSHAVAICETYLSDGSDSRLTKRLTEIRRSLAVVQVALYAKHLK